MKLLAAQQAKLGFIGLDNMGSRIALRPLARGYELTAFDRDNTKAGALIVNGAVLIGTEPTAGNPGPRAATTAAGGLANDGWLNKLKKSVRKRRFGWRRLGHTYRLAQSNETAAAGNV